MGVLSPQSAPSSLKPSPLAARSSLFQSATPWTDEQKTKLRQKIVKLTDELCSSLLWPSVQAAHENEGIKPETFAQNLFDGRFADEKTLHQRNSAWQEKESPYRQLDLKVWVQYLSAGKDRVLPDKSHPDDQNAFFRYFDISIDPNTNSPDPKYLQALKTAELTGNNLRHENLENITPASMAEYLYALQNILKAMRNIAWKDDIDFWRNMLTIGFYNAFGKVSYRIADIIAYNNACGSTVPAAQQPQIEKLLSDAGLAVDNGTVTFHGNIVDFSVKPLETAWQRAANNAWDDGVAQLCASLRAGKQALPEPMSYAQKKQTITVLNRYTQALKAQLSMAIETAHTEEGIDPQVFLQNLTIPTGPKNFILNRNHIPTKPYGQELQTWLKYLCYGGQRKLPTGGFATDQNAFFNFFNIPCPIAKSGRTEPEGRIVSHLRQLINARNYITAHVSDVTVERQTFQSLSKWYHALLALLVPMSQKPWLLQAECAQQTASLQKEFYEAAQPCCSAEDILESADIPANGQDDALHLLDMLQMLVRGERVIVRQEISTVIAALKPALYLQKALNDPDSWASGSLRIAPSYSDMASAVQLFEAAASIRPPIAAAQYYLGCCYLAGYGKDHNTDQGITLLRSADRLGYAPAQTALGRCYMNGLDGQLPDPRKAAAQYQKAAEQGDPDALYLLGCCYQTGSGVPRKESAEAIRLFRDAENRGHKHATFSLAKIFCTDTPTGDPMKKKGLATLQLLAEQKLGLALQLLADWYRTGTPELVSQDITKARELALEAGKQGYTDALFALACDYYNGTNTALREEDAFYLFYKAATAGHSQAKLRLAQCFESGIGTPVDFAQAFSWYEAYSQDHPDDMAVHKRLAQCYEDGVGVEKNKGLAMYQYQCAADLGDPEAQFVLGKLLDHYWIRQAAENKYPEAVSHLSFGRATKEFLPLYLACAEAGDAWAQLQLGRYYDNYPSKPDKAFFWYQKSALQEYPHAMFQLGCCYETGKGTEKDMRLAMQWYTKAADKGDPDGLCRLAKRYLTGGTPAEDDAALSADGLPSRPDKDKAQQLYRKAAILGAPLWPSETEDLDVDVSSEETSASLLKKRDYYALGKLYAKYNHWPEAFSHYKTAAEKGQWEAMFAVAYCYECGLGAEQDSQKAARWYAKLLVTGSDPENLANLLCKNALRIWDRLGNTVTEQENLYHDRGICACSTDGPDIPRKRVAADGSIVQQKEQNTVRTKPLWDPAVDKKLTGAFRMIQRAARLGSPKAMYLVGYCYQHGYGPFVNQRAADSWYLKAAEHGCATACATIGSYYRYGHSYGLPFEQDTQASIAWYRKAAVQGDDLAIRQLKELGIEL